MPALRIKYPKLGVITHVLRSERVTVGRAADNSIQIPHESVSNYHAEIVAEDGRYRLRDLHSTNHSLVDGAEVTERELTEGCQISFGSIECEFDPHATTHARPALALPPTAPAPPVAHLENENRELRAHIMSLQRRFDILGSARLTAGRVDPTPFAVAHEAMRSLGAERDELRQEVGGLRVEVGRLREDLAVTSRERDAAREAAAGLQSERSALQRALQQAEARLERLRTELLIAQETPPAPARPPLPPAPPKAPPAPRSSAAPPKPPASVPPTPPQAPAPPPVASPAPPVAEKVTPVLIGTTPFHPSLPESLREHVALLGERPVDDALLVAARAELHRLVDHTAPLSTNPVRRLADRFEHVLLSLASHGRPPATGTLRTLRQASELIERLLDPALSSAAAELPTAQILAIDDDPEILSTLAALLSVPGVEISTCLTAEEAMIAIEALRFDTILADIGLPGMDGTAFCTHARQRPTYRHTPILFLTGTDTLGKRAETSLSGGTEFIAKPFETAELSLKVETWTLRHQLHLG